MDSRKYNIFNALYQAPQSKDKLAELENVSTKTIENTINKYNEEQKAINSNLLEDGVIVYDRSLSAYRFTTLLPPLIPISAFMSIFQDAISNSLIKNDFLQLMIKLQTNDPSFSPLVETSSLSTMAKKIIMLNLAIHYNCIIKFDYVGNDKPLETKYVRPHKVHTNGFTYYLYGTYDKENINDIGSPRSFAINGIYNKIEPIQYTNEHFAITSECNAYGVISNDKYVFLKLDAISANFFKREGLFSQKKYEFISEEVEDSSVIIKMFYNSQQELIKLIQEWMPHISFDIQTNPLITAKIYKSIQDNFSNLFPN